MTCGTYINYAALTNRLKVNWMEHYKNTHPEEEGLPTFIVEGINEMCNYLSCLVNGDPLDESTWMKIGNLSMAIAECIDIHNKHNNTNIEKVQKEENTDV